MHDKDLMLLMHEYVDRLRGCNDLCLKPVKAHQLRRFLNDLNPHCQRYCKTTVVERITLAKSIKYLKPTTGHPQMISHIADPLSPNYGVV